MIPSPFHGIFSSMPARTDRFRTDGQEGATATLEVEQESSADDSSSASGSSSTQGQISVDVFEQDNYIIIRAPIAGVKLADLDIEVDGKVVTIRGQRTLTDEIPEDAYYSQECFWGEFSRSITLPVMIDPKKIRATFSKDSILKIIIPKEEKVKIIRINESG